MTKVSHYFFGRFNVVCVTLFADTFFRLVSSLLLIVVMGIDMYINEKGQSMLDWVSIVVCEAKIHEKLYICT